MKKIILLTVLLFTFFHSYVIACTCAPPDSFCETIVDSDGNFYADVILRGTYAGVSGTYNAQVDNVLYGDFNESEVSISGSFCDYFPVPLEEGNEYIFALRIFEDRFFFITCGISYLKIENEVVTGKIAEGIESIDYENFGTIECGDNFNISPIENILSIFPNPTPDILKVKNTSTSNSISNIQIQFTDVIGRELYTFKKEDDFFAGEIWTIDLKNFAAGVYFLKLNGNEQDAVLRIVKQ